MAINPLPNVDYSVDVASPFQAAVQGLQFAAGREQLDALRGQRDLEAQQRQAAQAQQLQFQSGLNQFFAKPPEQRNFAELQPLLIGANKQQFDALKEIGANMSAEKLANSKKFSSQLLLAYEANPETAQSILQDHINAEQDPIQKRAFQDVFSIGKQDPKRAAQLVESLGAGTFGKDWYEGITAVRTERRTAASAPAELRQKLAAADKEEAEAKVKMETATDDILKAKHAREYEQARAAKEQIAAQYAGPLAQADLNLNAAQIKNINSEIGNRAAKMNLDTQTMQATVAEKLSSIQKNLNEMPADTRKLVNDSAVAASASKQSADHFNDLAKRLDASGGGYGVFSSASDFLKKGAGFQGGMTQLRQEYTRLRNTAAIKSLPPGPATDKDIAMALKGFPSENASAGDLSSFLRGMAKLQDIDASVGNAKTDWLANNNGVLTRAKNTFQAGDYATKPGESFNDFSQRVIQDVSNRYNPATQTNLVNQIPTDANPRPAAPAANIRSQADAILRGGQ